LQDMKENDWIIREIWNRNLSTKPWEEKKKEHVILYEKHRIFKTQEWFVVKCAQYISDSRVTV
jgi:hypothetical protein